ncbi:MAG: prepilin peptidase [Chloroflexi bacterium]|nr:prepilin peptidase [Chloroflexota bacterium]
MNISIGIPIFLGWFSALLVNYLADVLPATRKLTSPACKNCSAKFAWKDYLLLKNCSACEHSRGWRAWLTQGLGIAATVYMWLYPPSALGFWLGWLLLIYLAVVFVIDIEHRLVLHPVSYFGVLLGLVVGTKLHGILIALLGGALGFGIMFSLYYLGVLFARWMSKRRGETVIEEGDALGFGDVNLAGVLGLILGSKLIWIGILTAILAGGVVSLILIIGMLALKRYEAFAAIPYAPFLILGAVWLLYF